MKKFLKELAIGFIIAGLFTAVWFWSESKTYTVYETVDKQVVRVVDPRGHDVNISRSDLEKLTYEVVWVSRDYQPPHSK